MSDRGTAQEEALFPHVFNVELEKVRRTPRCLDGYRVLEDDPLREQHALIEAVEQSLGSTFEGLHREVVQAALAESATCSTLNEVRGELRGRLLLALLFRLLWISVNGYVGPFPRVEDKRYNYFLRFTAESLARGLGKAIEVPVDLAARWMRCLVRSQKYYVLEVFAPFLDAIEASISTRERDAEARAAFSATADWFEELARTEFRYDGGDRRSFGGVPLRVIIRRLRALGSEGPLEEAQKLAKVSTIDLGVIPVLDTASPVSSKPRRGRGASVSKIAQEVFGATAWGRLAFEAHAVGDAGVLESAPLPWASASSYLSRASAGARAAGLTIALTERSLPDAAPDAEQLRGVLRAGDSDEAFTKWLAKFVERNRSELTPLVPELESHVLSTRRGRAAGWSSPDPVRVVCLAGAPDLALPALYGLGPFNDCPDPEIHGAVLGRWSREFGAQVRYVGHDRLHLRVESPPQDVSSIVWAAIGACAYTDDLPDLFDRAEAVRGDAWRFWWD